MKAVFLYHMSVHGLYKDCIFWQSKKEFLYRTGDFFLYKG